MGATNNINKNIKYIIILAFLKVLYKFIINNVYNLVRTYFVNIIKNCPLFEVFLKYCHRYRLFILCNN